MRRLLRRVGIATFAIGLVTSQGVSQDVVAPVTPGFTRLTSADALTLEGRGQLLFGELGCIHCHSVTNSVHAMVRLSHKAAPDLNGIGSRATPQWIQAFLRNPQQEKPGTMMPDIFHASDAGPKEGAIDYLTHFLVSLGGPVDPPNLGGSDAQVEMGQKLFESVGCVACHAPEEAAEISTPVIPFSELAEKTTVEALTGFLLEPTKHRPSGRMPSLNLSEAEARSIAVYLLRDQLEEAKKSPGAQAEKNGVSWEYYEGSGWDHLPDFDSLEPIAKGESENFTLAIDHNKRSDDYAIRFKTMLRVSESGSYGFEIRSDDGSRLWVNGELVVDNDGVHPATNRRGFVELSAGSHELVIGYFEKGNDEEFRARWSPPNDNERMKAFPNDVLWTTGGTPMLPIVEGDFALSDERAALGRRMFGAMGCAACHRGVDGIEPLRRAPTIGRLNAGNDTGCIGDNVARGLPNYHLSDEQKAALRAAVANPRGLIDPVSPEETVTRTMAAANCFACHERDGIGGPDEARDPYFKTAFEIDLGPEGRIPPALDHAGAKFKRNALHRILYDGELRVRDYMATRMPEFPDHIFQHGNAEEDAFFIQSLIAADNFAGNGEEPPFEGRVEIGHKFVGNTGLACITCHRVNGQQAIGIQGIDLGTMYDRLQPGWFKRFVLNPPAYREGTRMPTFWPNGVSPFPNILDGDPEAQVESIWAYLSLKSTMPTPAGIRPVGSVGMEIIPSDKPIVHRTFMLDVGPRAILTGYPEKLSVAFDANKVRMAKAWRGRFFDQSGVESGRTDKFLGPLSEDVIDLPAGPNFAFLDSPESAWPTAEMTDRNVGGDFLGYRLDENDRPIFKYQLESVQIEEKPIPELEPGGPALRRSIVITGNDSEETLYFLAAEGQAIVERDGEYVVDNEIRVRVSVEPESAPVIRKAESGEQLLVPIDLSAGNSTLNVEMRW